MAVKNKSVIVFLSHNVVLINQLHAWAIVLCFDISRCLILVFSPGHAMLNNVRILIPLSYKKFSLIASTSRARMFWAIIPTRCWYHIQVKWRALFKSPYGTSRLWLYKQYSVWQSSYQTSKKKNVGGIKLSNLQKNKKRRWYQAISRGIRQMQIKTLAYLRKC